MTKNIDEFVRIQVIADLIQVHKAHYCDKGNWWLCPDDEDRDIEFYLDGAWFMFQELK